MTNTKSFAERMADAAEMDLALPYSLVCDAWDDLEQDNEPTFSRYHFENALAACLDEYEADQNGYWTDERIARARGEEATR